MTSQIKTVLVAVSGAVGGAVAASTIWYIVTRKKEEKAVEDALEAQRGLYERYIAKNQENSEEDGDSEPEEETSDEKIQNEADTLMRKADTNKTSYSKKVDQLEYRTDRPEKEEYRAGPYLISEDQFSEERLNYDKVNANYFEPDGILLDESADVYEPMDITRDVSWSCLQEFQNDPELEEIYVRNDLQSTDYWIKRCRHPVEQVE